MGQNESGEQAPATVEQPAVAASAATPAASADRVAPAAPSAQPVPVVAAPPIASVAKAAPATSSTTPAPAAAAVPAEAAASALAAVKVDEAAASIAAASIAAPAKPQVEKSKASGERSKEDAPAKSKGKGKQKDNGRRLCVKNLGEDMTQEQLKTLFEPFGSLLSVNVKTKEDGTCRGFAFIAFASADEASNAISGMNEKDHGGKKLVVALASQDKLKQEGLPSTEPRGKGKSKTKGIEKGGDKGKGKGKGKSQGKKGADTTVPARPVGYVSPLQQYCAQPYPQYGAQPAYPGYPYQTQAYNPQQQNQLAAAQYAQGIAQMQAMVQGMYLQAAQQQAAQAAAAQLAGRAPTMPPGPVNSQAYSAPSKEYFGTLKSISTRNNYGFIHSEEVKKMTVTPKDPEGRDVHISVDLLPDGGKEPGAKLRFTIGYNAKGHPQAQTCALAM